MPPIGNTICMYLIWENFPNKKPSSPVPAAYRRKEVTVLLFLNIFLTSYFKTQWPMRPQPMAAKLPSACQPALLIIFFGHFSAQVPHPVHFS